MSINDFAGNIAIGFQCFIAMSLMPSTKDCLLALFVPVSLFSVLILWANSDSFFPHVEQSISSCNVPGFSTGDEKFDFPNINGEPIQPSHRCYGKTIASLPSSQDAVNSIPITESSTTSNFKARIACMNFIKMNLKDPSSFRKISSIDDVYKTKQFVYSATNSFGGRIQTTFDCSPFFG